MIKKNKKVFSSNSLSSTKTALQSLENGLKSCLNLINKARDLFIRIVEEHRAYKKGVYSLNEKAYFNEVLAYFSPNLNHEKASVPLNTIYDVAFHKGSHSIIIANRGSTLLCRSPQTNQPYMTRHIACTIYRPGLGAEVVNVGLVGYIYEGEVIIRSESACAPAFLFGSQRCSCAYQWASGRELAAYLNPIELPHSIPTAEFDKWVQKQFVYHEGQHLPLKKGPGLILMHLDSQGGMGSGYTPKEFVWDLYSRALLRQAGENTVEQMLQTSIKESYQGMGLMTDARLAEGQIGYQLTPIILDFLRVSSSLICLSNNPHKLAQLMAHGYQIKKVKTLGQVDQAGLKETRQKEKEFGHLELNPSQVSFEEEMQRLKAEIDRLLSK